MITELVAADIGGTHARFALAQVADGRVIQLGEALTLKTADYAGLVEVWQAFAHDLGRQLPSAAALAFAYPVENDLPQLTNMPWTIDPRTIPEALGIVQHLILNDFCAIGHAIATLGPSHFVHIAGPDIALPENGVISIVGPGTGLGVGMMIRKDGRYQVIASEGGNMDFSPHDDLDDRLMAALRRRYSHVSAERLVSGPALMDIYAVIANAQPPYTDDRDLWQAALQGNDPTARAALERFCLCLGAFSGNIALAHGANALVLAGGLGLRLREHLPASGFAERLSAKGEYRSIMQQLPVKLIAHAEPGLYGAAAAFAFRFTASRRDEE
ncbi:MAG TPA: glucokinase [Sphingomicrobium sp.]|jgi:glucokinase|nr:glucokinase [Sphingomicrobium sp.]